MSKERTIGSFHHRATKQDKERFIKAVKNPDFDKKQKEALLRMHKVGMI